MRKNKLIYFGSVLFLISIIVDRILWYLGNLVTNKEFLNLHWLFEWMPFTAVLGLVLVIFGAVLKIQDKLLRKIFLTAAFFSAIFWLGNFISSLISKIAPFSCGNMPPPTFPFPSNPLCQLTGLWGLTEALISFLTTIAFLGFCISLITGLILSLIKFIKKKNARTAKSKSSV